MDQPQALNSFRLDPTDSVGARWEKWIARFENYLVAVNIMAATRKRSQLLHVAGEEVFDVAYKL